MVPSVIKGEMTIATINEEIERHGFHVIVIGTQHLYGRKIELPYPTCRQWEHTAQSLIGVNICLRLTVVLNEHPLDLSTVYTKISARISEGSLKMAECWAFSCCMRVVRRVWSRYIRWLSLFSSSLREMGNSWVGEESLWNLRG